MKALLPFIWLRYWQSCEDSSGPQSVNSSLISSLVFWRVYGLGKATTAVTAATRITSNTGYLPAGGGDNATRYHARPSFKISHLRLGALKKGAA